METLDFFEPILEALRALASFLESISGTITAVATLALAVLTWVLARATNSMAKVTSSANVVASLEVNQWSFRHLDLVVHNTGNAAAFDVTVTFTPPLPFMSSVDQKGTPLGNISVLRPSQTLTTSVNDKDTLRQNVYSVQVEWKQTPTSRRRENNAYNINLAVLGNLSRLGAVSPEIQIAEQIKKLREDWKGVAQGHQNIKVDSYDRADRERIREELIEMHREMQEAEKRASEEKGQQSHE